MPDTASAHARTGLDARYGRSPGGRRRERLIVIIAAAVFVAIFAAWVIWAGLDNGQGTLESRDLAHSIIDDRTVSITWEVSVPAGTAVSCALQAQNEAHGIVGWRIVDLPASTAYTSRYTETVRTVQPAVTGLIYRCWLT